MNLLKRSDTFIQDLPENGSENILEDQAANIRLRRSFKALVETKSKETVSTHSTTDEFKAIITTYRPKFKDIKFVERQSLLSNPENSNSLFYGFYVLFWMAIGILCANTLIQNYFKTGSFLRFHIIRILYRDIFLVAAIDSVMFLTTFITLAIQIACKKKYISWNSSGWILQNVWQTFFLFSFNFWTLHYRNFPWIGEVFILLHSLVLLMKQHSFAFYCGYLYQVESSLELAEKFLKSHQDINDAKKTNENHKDKSADKDEIVRAEVASFKNYINTLKGELSIDENNYFPKNITAKSFLKFLMYPTVVYELKYPMKKKIDYKELSIRILSTFGVLFLMIWVAEFYMYDTIIAMINLRGLNGQEKIKAYIPLFIDLVPPFALIYMLTFYIIWESILNGIAELSRFGDRKFYGPWWNCVTWDEFARDWNSPVHQFLLRHVYHSSISFLHVSKSTATLLTFFFSACIHELVMLCIFKKLRAYLMLFQMSQLPLVALSRTKYLRHRKLLGNIIFWFGILTGPAIACSLYLTF